MLNFSSICFCQLLNNVSAIPSVSQKSGISKGALVGIILGGIAAAATLSAIVSLLILRMRTRDRRAIAKRRRCEYKPFL